MATDGPDPTPCDNEIFSKGETVYVTHSLGGSNAIEKWVKWIAAVSGQRVDWHFCAGRIVIKAIGNLGAVREAIQSLKAHEEKMRSDERAALYGNMNFGIKEPSP